MKLKTDMIRRGLLAAGAVGAALALAPPAFAASVRNRFSMTRRTFPATPDPEDAERMVQRVIRGRELTAGLVRIEVTETSENGSSVPLITDVNCSMSGNDYPEIVHIFVLHNPFPEVARYHYGPWNGTARTEMRLRMRQSSEIVVIAEMADGRVGELRQPVEVLAGACG